MCEGVPKKLIYRKRISMECRTKRCIYFDAKMFENPCVLRIFKNVHCEKMNECQCFGHQNNLMLELCFSTNLSTYYHVCAWLSCWHAKSGATQCFSCRLGRPWEALGHDLVHLLCRIYSSSPTCWLFIQGQESPVHAAQVLNITL